MKYYTVYTDGSCPGNKRVNRCSGHYAYLIVEDGGIIHEFVGEENDTTNNRVEMMAVISALEYLLPQSQTSEILIMTDSTYITENWEFVESWKKHDWKRANRKPVLNVDLWKRLDKLYPRFVNLHFQWVRGHGDNKYNIRVDHLARQA